MHAQAGLAAARGPAGLMSDTLTAVQLRNPTLAERIYTIVKRARTLLDLGVEVTATLDVRGTLGLDRGVPVTARTHLDATG